jgi:hypothetical protein
MPAPKSAKQGHLGDTPKPRSNLSVFAYDDLNTVASDGTSLGVRLNQLDRVTHMLLAVVIRDYVSSLLSSSFLLPCSTLCNTLKAAMHCGNNKHKQPIVVHAEPKTRAAMDCGLPMTTAMPSQR